MRDDPPGLGEAPALTSRLVLPRRVSGIPMTFAPYLAAPAAMALPAARTCPPPLLMTASLWISMAAFLIRAAMPEYLIRPLLPSPRPKPGSCAGSRSPA